GCRCRSSRWGSPEPRHDLEQKLAAMARADFLTCSGVRQRLWFLPFMEMAGWQIARAAEELLPVIPFSMAPVGPAPLARADRLVYGGFSLPWQEPTVPLQAALDALTRAESGELLFVGGPHPRHDLSGGRFEPLLARLRDHPRARLL